LSGTFLSHFSVLNTECTDHLLANYDRQEGEKTYADLTFGAGGHSLSLLDRHGDLQIIACDQDPDAFENGLKIIQEKNYTENINLLNINFAELPEYLSQRNVQLNGVVADLGVSSHQFDKDERGFSFRRDAPLDMRMNYKNSEIYTAEEIVNGYLREELEQIFFEFGEERFSKRIAEKIIEIRSREKIKTTKQLEDIVFHCYPKKMRFGKTNPSTRVFQALRIEVNQELKVLSEAIPRILECLKVGARMVVISFHSLEDRIVKRAFKTASLNGGFKLIVKKPILPSKKEINENSRSRSAKLRVIEKI